MHFKFLISLTTIEINRVEWMVGNFLDLCFADVQIHVMGIKCVNCQKVINTRYYYAHFCHRLVFRLFLSNRGRILESILPEQLDKRCQ